ncbi:ACT domain-containing protein [Candidatus Kaiserbacteria bacterium]|nr:ACT domain-containing protein [Candidatus Kaiserbacteria bacterium]
MVANTASFRERTDVLAERPAAGYHGGHYANLIDGYMAGITVKQVTQLKVVVAHVPGSLARVAEALQKADVNIEGTCHTEGTDETAPFRMIVDKPDEAKKAIESLGEPVTFEQCLSVQSEDDKPGFIARVARKLGAASINIQAIYHTSSGRGGSATMYISVDKANLPKALELLKSL